MKTGKTALTVAIGTAFAASLAGAPVASADENPFAAHNLGKGYMVADAQKGMEGKCGMGKCGVGKCGAQMMDTDKDGKVSKDEYMKHHEAVFTKMDASKDGTLEDSEMGMGKMKGGNCGGMK
jgi:uncharacterized low-complexity protein